MELLSTSKESYLHAKPDLGELQLPTSGDTIKTASLPEMPKSISQTRNQYLRFAYERIWSILVYLAYTYFQKVAETLEGPFSRKKERFKQQLVGSGVKFTETLYQGQHWKDLVARSDCGILLLVKQRFLPVIATHKISIAQQYLDTIYDTNQLCRVVCNILIAFSPDDRISISYYTKAYKELSDLITRKSTSSASRRDSEDMLPLTSSSEVLAAGLISTASIPAAPFADHEFVFQCNRNDVQGFFSDRSRVSRSPSPPQALLVSEKLFRYIKVYFKNSCRNMIFDDHGTLLTPNGAKLQNNLCNDFDSYCFSATMLKEKGLHVEFGRALSKAFALVKQILQAEHPRTLACFLEVLIHLRQTGLPEVTSFLRDFIKEMSAQVTRTEHPWGQICQLLGELDSESLDQAMAQAWKCTTDTFDSELGTLTPLAVSVRLDYIKRVYGITNHREEEWHLLGLLAQFGGIPSLSTPRVMLNLAHNLNRQGRNDEAEKMARKVLSLLQNNEIYAGRIVEKIESLKIVSRSQFNQGNRAAEQTMREAIRMIVDEWGIQHSWVPEFMNVLEGWLRGWGRKKDANKLRGEIEELMGTDEIDE